MDVWVTQVGSGQFHNQTRGVAALELVNPSVRSMGFSPDGSFVTFWVRRQIDSTGGPISIWRVATLGGQPRPHFEGIAEADCRPTLRDSCTTRVALRPRRRPILSRLSS
jgi:hypothetical protein